MKNENDYLSSNPGVFQANNESRGYSTERTNFFNAQDAMPRENKASIMDDTGWDEPVYDNLDLEEETY